MTQKADASVAESTAANTSFIDEAPFAEAGVAAGEDIAGLVRTRRLAAVLVGAVGSGLLLSAAFPPLELDVAAWFALVPLLVSPVSRRMSVRLLAGCVFGFTHTVTNLHWLNTVGFGAGFLLAIYCMVFPAAWYLFATALANPTRPLPRQDTEAPGLFPAVSIAQAHGGAIKKLLAPLALAAAWVALEWVQGWLFTGFPWNQLGISQWRHGGLLAISRITGIYGLSFVIVAVNVALAGMIADRLARLRKTRKRTIPWPAVTASALLLLVVAYGWNVRFAPPPDTSLRVIGVQGDIPQLREYSPDQLEMAIDVYRNLTLAAAKVRDVDLVVWPESALPAPLLWDEACRDMLAEIFPALDAKLLVGSLNPETFLDRDGREDYLMFNSAMLFSEQGARLQTYNKVHRVPFGEYVPFGRYFPWLVDLIGMGRDLTPGAEFTLFSLANEVKAGVNICFEDAFPRVSREFSRRGADLLMTITNDAWYVESSGPRQHMLHAIVRAVENGRPLFRSGNNSDTCLILPNGQVRGWLRDPLTGNRFIRGYQVYDIPIARNAPLTFYARHGDVFAILASLGASLCTIALIVAWARKKCALCACFAKPRKDEATKPA